MGGFQKHLGGTGPTSPAGGFHKTRVLVTWFPVTLCNHHRLAISIISRYRWILNQQQKQGQQLRFPDAPFPDILHSYFSVCGLCLCGLLPPLDAMLGMSQASRQAAEDRGVLPPWKVKEQDAGKWEEMIRNCSKWSTNLLKELRPLDSNYPILCDVWKTEDRISHIYLIWVLLCHFGPCMIYVGRKCVLNKSCARNIPKCMSVKENSSCLCTCFEYNNVYML